MDTGANVASYSAANYFIEGINEVGIDYLFSNMGTDHAPIIEAFAGRRRRGQKVPTIVVLRMRTPPRTWPAATR